MQTTAPKTPAPPLSQEEAVMSWLDHARELRDRMLKACLAVFVGLLLGFWAVNYNEQAVVYHIVERFTVEGVQTVRPAEAFTNVIKLALGIGVALAMPVIVYQILAFVAPALTRRERRMIFLILPFVTVCFIAGLAFGWFVTVPAAFRFLLGYGPENVQQQPALAEFLSLITRLLLINGFLFELPILVYSVIWLGVVERKTLARYRRYSVLVIVIISAIITPTGDPLNLAFTAVPMYMLYELGLLLAFIAPRRKAPATHA